MKIKKVPFRDILLLVALYANLIFGYFYVQTIKEEQRKTAVLIAELEVIGNSKDKMIKFAQ